MSRRDKASGKLPIGFLQPLWRVPRIGAVARQPGVSLVDWLREANWGWLTKKILSVDPSFPDRIAKALEDIDELIDHLTLALESMCNEIREAAREKRITVKAVAGSCYKRNCSICFGEWKLHYPLLRIYDRETKRWVDVKRAELKGFLRDLGFDGRWIQRFEDLDKMRRVVVAARNWLLYACYTMGLVDVEVEG